MSDDNPRRDHDPGTSPGQRNHAEGNSSDHPAEEPEIPGDASDAAAEALQKEELTLLDNFKILFGASKGFWLVNQVNFLDGVAYFGILNLLTLFISRDVGLSISSTTIAVSTFTGLVTLFMFGGGFVSDWLGVRKAITLCLLGLLAGRTLLLSSPVYGGATTLWLGLLLMAVATGILQPALYAGVKEFSDPRTATIGYSLLYSIMNLGIVAETVMSPLIREWSRPELNDAGEVVEHGMFHGSFLDMFVNEANGIGGVFIFLIGVTGLMLALHFGLFTKRVEERDRYVDYEAPDPAEREKKTLLQSLRAMPFLNARFLFFIFVLLPVRTLFAHQFLTIPEYVFRAYSENVADRLEWLQGLNPLIIVIFVPLIAAITRKVHVVKMMIVGTTVSALTTFILAPGPDVTRLILYVVLFSLGEAIWSSRFLEYVADLAPAGKVGAYMGIAGIPWFLAKATTGWYAGSMIERFIPLGGPHDSGTMWLIYAFIACLSPIGLLLGYRWVTRGVRASAEAQA
ncbi:MAG: Dipeptide and tripeptide permease A [Calditrichaeota bacterium]|nr:Dipeptide and tripeptide permease A [Calditrichota bacterium]